MNTIKKVFTAVRRVVRLGVAAAVAVAAIALAPDASAQIKDIGPFTFSGTNLARYQTNLTSAQSDRFTLRYNSAKTFGWYIKSPTSGTLASNAIYAVRFAVRDLEFLPSSELYITNALNSTNIGSLIYPEHARFVYLYYISQPPNTNTSTHRFTFFQN